MLFTQPIPFAEALKSAKVKTLLPTSLSSKELGTIGPDILKRAQVSAKVTNAQFLQEINDTIESILQPIRVERQTQEGIVQVTEGDTLSSGKQRLKDLLGRLSYQPEAGSAGTIQDLSSDQRLNLILETQSKMAFGYGQWAEGQDEDILDVWPAQEFYRAEERKEIRDWPTRWIANGGQFFEGASDYSEGRMIALKNDPIWESISAFGLPYPPFDFNSGMDVRDITRKEAEMLGLISIVEKVTPEERNFLGDFEVKPNLDPSLLEQLLKDIGDGFQISKGILQRANESVLTGKQCWTDGLWTPMRCPRVESNTRAKLILWLTAQLSSRN